MSNAPNSMKVAGEFTVGDWAKLDLTSPETWDAAGWTDAIKVYEIRIVKRFIEPIDELIRLDRERFDALPTGHQMEDRPTFGFAILALDCLLIETLQGVSEGLVNHADKSEGLFIRFLEGSDSLSRFFSRPNSARQFYRNYRCALLHRGATDGTFLVHGNATREIGGKKARLYVDTLKVHAVNRTQFHEAVVKEFWSRLKCLRGPPRPGNPRDLSAMKEARLRLKAVFDVICGV